MISIAFLLAASAATQMAPAAKGMLQCQMPDVVFKTCFSLSKITPAGPNVFAYETKSLIAPDERVIATIKSTATVSGEKQCDTIRASQIDSMTFTVDGQPVSAAQSAKYRARLRRNFAPILGKTVCTVVVTEDTDMGTVQAWVSGTRLPMLDYAMKWVAPSDGWMVAP